MQELIDAIVQVGILPVIIGVLLFDYSKKIEGMRLELVKINENMILIKDHIEQCKKSTNQ